MKQDSCKLPLEVRLSPNDPSVAEILGPEQPPQLPVLYKPAPLVTYHKQSPEEVLINLFEESLEKAAREAAQEAPSGRTFRQLITDLVGEAPITLAYQVGVRVDALRTNWDLWASATERIGGVLVSESFRVGRISPSDLKHFLLRRALSMTELRVILDSALDAASSNIFRVNLDKAKTAFGHTITTDASGLAMDFNPNRTRLKEAARRQLLETTYPEGELIPDEALEETMELLQRQMNSYLFGEGADTGATIIRMTGARSQDEISAVRALAQEAQMRGEPGWLGLTSMSTDKEITRVIQELKDSGYVFHHSGKVDLDVQGYPAVEMQLIETTAHEKFVTTYEGIDHRDVDLWRNALNDSTSESRVTNKVESLLQHVGGCKVFSLFYGIGAYK